MKKVRIEDAVGQTLCHDITGISGGKKGVMFSRGHIIRPEDITRLMDIGKNHIFTWEPDADEVHEDDAALAAARAVCGSGIIYDEKPSEGKILMYAKTRGLFRLNGKALREINSIGDYTIACLPDMIDVAKGSKLGGIRIVPLVTKRGNVDAVLDAAKAGRPVFTVQPYKKLKSCVIITGSEVYYGRIEDKFEPIIRKKLDYFGAEYLGAVKCPDDLDMIMKAIDDFKAKGAELILLTGGMSVDPDDLTPSAIRSCGASLITQGMPMQPGNMLTIAYLGETVLIGVPGASMHSPVTSLDVFLPRVFAGVPITTDDIPGLGEGGFCSVCEICTHPRCYFGLGRDAGTGKKDGPVCQTEAEPHFSEDIRSGDSVPFTLSGLYGVIADRKTNRKPGSYTTYLFEKGIDKILKKIGEESAEVIIAGKAGGKPETIYEIADLIYHTMVLMAEMGIRPDDIMKELESRHGKRQNEE